jgi:hypothetical protein
MSDAMDGRRIVELPPADCHPPDGADDHLVQIGENGCVSARYAIAALVGLLLGLGLGLASNVSGVVLAFYGLALAPIVVAVVSGLRRWRA